jgi:tetratricopeptide (TPR) repeat protein
MNQDHLSDIGTKVKDIERWNHLCERAELVLMRPQRQYPWNDIITGAMVARPDGHYTIMAAVERNTFRGFHKIDKDAQGAGEIFKNYLTSQRDTIISQLKTVKSMDDLHLVENKICVEIRPLLTNIKPVMLNSYNKIRKPLDLYIEHLVTMAEELVENRKRLVGCLFLPLDNQMFQQANLFSEQELDSGNITRSSTYSDVTTEQAYLILQKTVKTKAEAISANLGKPFHPIYFDLLWNGRVDRWGVNLFETNPSSISIEAFQETLKELEKNNEEKDGVCNFETHLSSSRVTKCQINNRKSYEEIEDSLQKKEKEIEYWKQTVRDDQKKYEEDIKELQEKIHEKEKEMLSFFTHTMRNALATAPESLRQAIHLLGSDVYEKDTKHYQAINKIAALFSTLSLTDCLIDTFKQSISDPQEFKQFWQKDHTGEATPKWVIASALRQSLNRIIFMSDTTELRKLLKNPETALIKATRKSFIEEVLPLNVDSQGIDVFYDWTLKHIPAIEVSITDSDKLNFGVNQIRFSLLFAITSELILNALKYWDGENRIQISWQLEDQDNYVFSVKNHCKANAASNLAGTHKGLAFIKRLVELLGEQAHFVCKSEGQLFTAELILNKTLFDGES